MWFQNKDQFDKIKFNAFVANKIIFTAQYYSLYLLPKISNLIKTRFTKIIEMFLWTVKLFISFLLVYF